MADEWWLISERDVQKIRDILCGYISDAKDTFAHEMPKARLERHRKEIEDALHTLDSGLHRTLTVPADFLPETGNHQHVAADELAEKLLASGNDPLPLSHEDLSLQLNTVLEGLSRNDRRFVIWMLRDMMEERRRQEAKGYTREHDDEHYPAHWASWLNIRTAKLILAAASMPDCVTEITQLEPLREYRRRLVQLLTVAMCAYRVSVRDEWLIRDILKGDESDD